MNLGLHAFVQATDGASLQGSLVLYNSVLYGLAGEGGSNGDYSDGPCDAEWDGSAHWCRCPGTLFAISLGSNFSNGSNFEVLHAFGSAVSCTSSGSGSNTSWSGTNYDGMLPWSSLAVNGSGWLYGVTSMGGSDGKGVLFHYEIAGSAFVVDHNFGFGSGFGSGTVSGDLDGKNPFGSVAVLADGVSVIGTTPNDNTHGAGTAWVWNPTNGFQFVGFETSTTGVNDQAGFAQTSIDNNGYAWGATIAGTVGSGRGAMFSFDPSTLSLTAEPSFPANGTAGSCDLGAQYQPYGTVFVYSSPALGVGGHDGEFVVTRLLTGSSGTGSIFEMAGPLKDPYKLSDAFDFDAVPSDGAKDCLKQTTGEITGAFPNGTLAEDDNGILYGITTAGGDGSAPYAGTGVIYSYDYSGGSSAVIYSFGPETGPAFPYGGLIYGSGVLYGTTYGSSAVFAFTLGSGE